MRDMLTKTSSHRGVALLLTLWCVAIVAIATVAVARLIDLDTENESIRTRRFEARQLALTGIAHGSNPALKKTSDLLHQDLPDGERLSVQVTSENARLNINILLREAGNTTLKELFALWGIPDDESRVAIDSLVDWSDANELRRLNGAEREHLLNQTEYSLPQNRDFRSIEEMARVRGMDAVSARHPGWRESFSVFSGAKLDIQDAPADLMQARGLPTEVASRIVEMRNGPDREPGTRDDIILADIASAATALGLDPSQIETLQRIFQVKAEPYRVESTALIANTQYRITTVVNRKEAKSILWEEQ